jgi:hypothetical protein
MKYYTQTDVEDIVAYIAGWTLGQFRNHPGKLNGNSVVEETRKRFRPREIKDFLEKPVKK